MEEKENHVVETQEAAAPVASAEVKSFRCTASKGDLHTFFIAFLTSAIVLALYHVGFMVYDMFSPEEAEAFYCYCHQNAGSEEEEEEKPRKFSPEQRERFRARMERFKKLPPEVREKVKNMSKEERREFFKKLDDKRPPREGRGNPEGRGKRDRRPGDAPRSRERDAE